MCFVGAKTRPGDGYGDTDADGHREQLEVNVPEVPEVRHLFR